MEPVKQQELHLRDYLRLIRKRHRLILACVVLVTAMAIVFSLMSPNVYQGRATLQVQGQSRFVISASQPFDEGGGTLTPESIGQLVNSPSYRELTDSILLLTEGYGMDLTARRSQDEMVSLFEEDLMKKGLPLYFGRLALQASGGNRRKLNGIDLPFATVSADESLAANDGASLARRLSSVEKDEAIKQAGALAKLARRLKIDLYSLNADEIEPKAIEIMNSSLIRELPNSTLRGRRWEALPLIERGAAVQAAYRELPKHDPDELDKKEMQESYSTRELLDTGMLSVAFDSLDRIRAMNGVDAMVCVIIWKNQYARKEAAQRIRQVAEDAIYGADGKGGVQGKLVQVNDQLRNFKKARKLPDMEGVRKNRSEQFARLQKEYQTVIGEIASVQQQVRSLNRDLATIPRTVSSPTQQENPIVGGIKEELVKAQAELQAERATFTDAHPAVQSQLSKVARLENEWKAEQARQPRNEQVNESPNPLYGQFYESLSKAQAELVGMEERKKVLATQLEAANVQLASIPDEDFKVSDLIGTQSTLGSSMETLRERYLEAQLNEATKTSMAKVVDLALEPGKKIKPKRTMNVILAVMLGLFLGLASAVLAETMDNRLRTREEVERALPGIPVLSAIPTFTADHPLVVH
ncbi:MAG: hypothetical protein KY468_18270, partial [Armatimonadetes bacterium]|nr:hypothetical protein [Armatimonadota bacterium]